MKLILYGTQGCHLCEEANAHVAVVVAGTDVTVEHVDIADDEQLLEQYGWKIPVLKKSDSPAILGWPFDPEAIQGFIDTSAPP